MPYKHDKMERRMSEEEAKDIIENEARSRDFWCADYLDQKERLQEAVDVIYNSISGNRYTVDYQDHQNGTRLIIRCELCSKDLSSLDPFKSHENGKAHNKIRQQILTPKNPNLQGDLKRRALNAYKGIFPTGSLEDLIDNKRNTVLGIQFVYKEVLNGKERFTCQLCKKLMSVESIPKSDMFSHLISRTHNSRYLLVKFNELTYDEAFAKNIEEMEGKIHGALVDFSMQYLLKVKSELASSNYVPLGKRSMKQIKDSPAGRSQHSSSSRSPREKSRRQKSRSHSRSASPIQVVSSSSREGRPPSPALFDIRINTPHPQLPPPMPQKPVMMDVGISVDISEQARHALATFKLLNRRDVLDKLAEHKLLQELLHLSLWNLNQKLEKYFDLNKSTIYIEADKKEVLATVATQKLKTHIKELKPILRNSSL